MSLKVKICGIADEDNAVHVAALSPDYMGFIFHEPSPRNAFSLPREIIARLPESTVPVGVFVNRHVDEIIAMADSYGIRTVQLHGDEPECDCRELKRRGFTVWKAVGIDGAFDFGTLNPYTGCVDCFVFDTKSPMRGGTGVKYDWGVLDCYNLDIPFMLSGGISPGDAGRIAGLSHPMLAGVDVNSRFEDAPGVKNIAGLYGFINELRQKI
ncbi:MAG: phosphoribosylanthranilate isomerase [Duncaniella sp.]|nr:phosphoribosylanthranilate isomerase [Duncaniella sp.]